jgi:hypothetical protein
MKRSGAGCEDHRVYEANNGKTSCVSISHARQLENIR